MRVLLQHKSSIKTYDVPAYEVKVDGKYVLVNV